MKIIYFVFFFLFNTSAAFGQVCNDYPCVIKKVKKAIAAGNYRFAFEQLESAEGYPNKNEQEISNFRKKIFNGMDKQKAEAINATKEAEKGKREAIASKLAAHAREVIARDGEEKITALRLAEAAIKASQPPKTDVIRCVQDICSQSFYPKKIINLVKRNAHQSRDINVVFSEKGDTFLSFPLMTAQVNNFQNAKKNNTIRIWNSRTGKNFMTIRPDTIFYNEIQLSQNSQFFAIRFIDNNIKVWDTKQKQPIITIKDTTRTNLNKHLFFKDNQPYLFAFDDSLLQIINISNNKIITQNKGLKGIRSIQSFDNGNKLIFAHTKTKEIKSSISSIDILTGEVSLFKNFQNEWVDNLAISNDNKLIALARNNTIEIYDFQSKEKIKELIDEKSIISSIKFSQDAKFLITESQNPENITKLWDLTLYENIQTFQGFNKRNASSSITPDNRYVLQLGLDNKVRAWSTYYDLTDPDKNATLNEEEKTYFGVPDWIKE